MAYKDEIQEFCVFCVSQIPPILCVEMPISMAVCARAAMELSWSSEPSGLDRALPLTASVHVQARSVTRNISRGPAKACDAAAYPKYGGTRTQPGKRR